MVMSYQNDPDRSAALVAGETIYFGRPCTTCGAKGRYTSSGCCTGCTKRRAADRQRGEPVAPGDRRTPINVADAARRQAARRFNYVAPPPEELCPPRPADLKCECCGKPSRHALHLDHDHVTGHFRGWLCFTCNRGIAALGDDLRGVLRAIEYLKRSKTR